MIYDYDKTQLLFCPIGRSGKPTLYSEVKIIAGNSFEDCSKLTGVVLPAGLEELSDEAFCQSGITSINSITINTSSTGGMGEKLYEVWYFSPGTGKWSRVKRYSAITTASFKPKYKGTNTVRVKVKDKRGVVVKKDIKVNVT